MRKELSLNIQNIEDFKQKLIVYGNRYECFAFLDSCSYNIIKDQHTHYEYDFLAAISTKQELVGNEKDGFRKLKSFQANLNDWLFGFLTYDLKNELENLESNNTDELCIPALHFFIPDIVIVSKNSKVSVLYHESDYTQQNINQVIESLYKVNSEANNSDKCKLDLQQRFNKNEYISTVQKLKDHIQRGDIYEINFCQEFFSHTCINPIETYQLLREVSPTPFSCFYKQKDKYLLSASPERFLKKTNNKVISQPIKGTIKRSIDNKEDLAFKKKLYNDPKERAENVMIVDLVRNDLSHTAQKGSVKVSELYGIYSFKQVHQMISTVVSEVKNNTNIIEIIKYAFPMGSMTGAPKIRAMELIENYEKTKRGLYSGAVGFITPENDFDFNVVIRSILYNETKKYVSFTVGGAITSLADPEKEYEECMLKAEAMLKVLN